MDARTSPTVDLLPLEPTFSAECHDALKFILGHRTASGVMHRKHHATLCELRDRLAALMQSRKDGENDG